MAAGFIKSAKDCKTQNLATCKGLSQRLHIAYPRGGGGRVPKSGHYPHEYPQGGYPHPQKIDELYDTVTLSKLYPNPKLKKLLNVDLQLSSHKIKPAGGGRAYVNFKNEEARDKALTVLHKYKWGKCVMSAEIATPVQDPLLRKQEQREKKSLNSVEMKLPIAERIEKSVTPYASLSYEEQLRKKEKIAQDILRKYSKELLYANPELHEFIKFHQKRRNGLICEFDPIVPAPVTENYRNKCEFTIGMNPETESACVGFRLASYKQGCMAVAPVGHLRHLPLAMKDLVQAFEKYVQQSSYSPFSPLTHEGVWRQLTVRTTRNNDLLVVVVIHPQSMLQEELIELKNGVRYLFTDGGAKDLKVSSLYFQQYAQRERGVDPEYELLYGEEYITETILGRKFRVSPDAFVQVNTAAGEVLYETVGKLADLDKNSNMLDICCGTGTIGICLADHCHHVYGIEMVKKAVEDAKVNAEENGLTNITVFEGKAEDIMLTVLNQCGEDKNSVGIVDPPRAGLHKNVVTALRKYEKMKRIVYVSCDPNNARGNFVSLGRPESRTYNGECFIPVKAVPVDLFPHTQHFELIILFERWDSNKWRRIMDGNPLPEDEEYFKRIPQLPQVGHNNAADIETIEIPAADQTNDDTTSEVNCEEEVGPITKKPRSDKD
ncbi:unnamed protein product, partial [Meganyctiphanes norvegica]